MVDGRPAIAIAHTALLQDVAVRAVVSTNTGASTSGGLTSEEEQPSYQARDTRGSLAQPTQEAAPALAGAGRHRVGIPSDLLKHDPAPLGRKVVSRW
jgi:hypothetical protein